MMNGAGKEINSFNPIIVIPAYKSFLNDLEQENLKITQFNNPSAEFLIYTHEKCNLDVYEKILKKFKVKTTSGSNLSSRKSYNELLKSPLFWEEFIDFEYILIHQLDAVLVKNIKTINPLNYDFIGAPWYPSFHVKRIYNDIFSLPFLPKRFLHELTVGNGGLCIRRTKKFFKAAKMIFDSKIGPFSSKVPEDVLFSFNQEFLELNYPTKDFAKDVFIEKFSKHKLLTHDPYGYHGLEKYHKSIRRKILEKFNSHNI
jgi:hypothetical protein